MKRAASCTHLLHRQRNCKDLPRHVCAVKIVPDNAVAPHKAQLVLQDRLSWLWLNLLLQSEIAPRFLWHNVVQTHALPADLKSEFHAWSDAH